MLDTFIITPAIAESAPESLKPEIRILESEDTYGKVAIEPLQQG